MCVSITCPTNAFQNMRLNIRFVMQLIYIVLKHHLYSAKTSLKHLSHRQKEILVKCVQTFDLHRTNAKSTDLDACKLTGSSRW